MAYQFAPTTSRQQRAVAAAAIFALHAAVAYVFVTGMIHTDLAPEALHSSAWVQLEPTPPVPQPVLPPVRPTAATKADRLALPVPVIIAPEQPAYVAPPPLAAATAPEATSEEAVRVIGRHQLPATVDYYPVDRRRAGVEGASYVQVCVDTQGVRSTEPLIERSSGDAELDRAALNVARHGRYARSVQGDQAVPNCYHFRIVFRIQ
jgi:TonB family protein